MGIKRIAKNALVNKPMNAFFTIVFSLWLVWWVWLEFIQLSRLGEGVPSAMLRPTPDTWSWWLVILILAEVIGLVRKKADGDTLSELVWKHIKNKPARRWLGRSIAVALTTRIWTIPLILGSQNGPSLALERFIVVLVPWTILVVGVGCWLWRHFPELGESG